MEDDDDDEAIYLVCYSRGREVYNTLARGKELRSRGLVSRESECHGQGGRL
jgi:hypothetical protein